MLAGLAASLCAIPFLLVAGLLVLGALMIVRFGVMLFPAFATLGLFPTMRGLVIGIGETVAAAVINAIVFGIGVALTVRGIGFVLAPGTGLPGWLRVVLVLLLSVVMWVALHPFRRMVHMFSRDGGRAEGGGLGVLSRGAMRAGGRLSTAFGGFAGAIVGTTLNRRQEGDQAPGAAGAKGTPSRLESVTVLGGTAPASGAGQGPGGAAPRAEAADEPKPPEPARTGRLPGGPPVLTPGATAIPPPGTTGGSRNGESRSRAGARPAPAAPAAASAAAAPGARSGGDGTAAAARRGAHDGPAVRSALFGTGGGRFEAGGAPAAAAAASARPARERELDHLDDDDVAELYRPGGAGVSGVRR